MSKQKTNIKIKSHQKELLKLEKEYFLKLKNIISSDNFKEDLLSIEKEIQLNYSQLNSIWNNKNKIKVAAERLVRHHIYKELMSEIKGIYESPISSDLGLVFKNCILCVDCKTLDTKGNSTDINYTSVEPNQISFDNSNFPYIKTKSNLETRARITRLPILTFVIKIIYRDDNIRFDLSRSYSNTKKPSLILACIPNGELSELFDKNLIKNFKTYKYYSEKDGKQYTPVPIPTNEKDKRKWVENYCLKKEYAKVTIPQERGSKDIFFDAKHHCYWTYTSENNKKMIQAILHGKTMRLNNKYLLERFDSNNEPWFGYEEIDI